MIIKKRLAIILIVFQVLSLAGFKVEQNIDPSETFGYYIGFFAPSIIAYFLLRSARKDKELQPPPEFYPEKQPDKEIFDDYSDYTDY